MTINVNTKIAALLKHNIDALEAIVSLSPMFTKLRNPILRKVIAGRTSISMASKLGGCSVNDFFNILQPLGFEIDTTILAAAKEEITKKPVPEFMKKIHPTQIIELDVRPVIEAGKDPLKIILEKVKSIGTGEILKIINSFEPTPLMQLLSKQGFESYAEAINTELVETYFYKKGEESLNIAKTKTADTDDWDKIITRFGGNLMTIDVRRMEMPTPMHTILNALANLPLSKALFVYHKRIPIFLLPELDEQQFSYRIKEVEDGEIQLLIYKD